MRRNRYRERLLPEWVEKVIAAGALAFIVWLFFVVAPLALEAMAR